MEGAIEFLYVKPIPTTLLYNKRYTPLLRLRKALTTVPYIALLWLCRKTKQNKTRTQHWHYCILPVVTVYLLCSKWMLMWHLDIFVQRDKTLRKINCKDRRETFVMSLHELNDYRLMSHHVDHYVCEFTK